MRKRGFENLRAAKAWKQEQINAVDGFKYVEKTYRWEDLEKYFRERHFSTVRASTSKRYEEDLRIRLMPEFQYMRLNDIHASYIETVKEKWVSTGLGSRKPSITVFQLFPLCLKKRLSGG